MKVSVIRNVNEEVMEANPKPIAVSNVTIRTATDFDWFAVGKDGQIRKVDIEKVVKTVNDCYDAIQTWPAIRDVLVKKPILFSPYVETFQTDGLNIFANPAWIEDKLNTDGLGDLFIAFVMVHEVFHVLYLHCVQEARADGHYSDHLRANHAMDYEINYVIGNFLRADGEAVFMEPAKSGEGLYNEDFAAMSWTAIYDKINPSEKKKTPLSDEAKEAFKREYERLLNEKKKSGELL